MSTFTMSLQEVIDIHGRNNIGLDSYPVLGEPYRTRLNDKIVDQYLNREIGQETVSLWRHAMRRKMAQIMPYYNKLYATETLIVDPLRTVDLHTLTVDDRSGESTSDTGAVSEGESNSTTDTESSGSNLSSEMPQTFIAEDGNYATSGGKTRADAKAESNSKETSKADTKTEAATTAHDVMDSRVTGFQGSQAQLIEDFRATILNIDMQIVNELEPLFMGIWNSGNAFTTQGNYPYYYGGY